MSLAQLVLVHGFTQTGTSWAPLVPAFEGAGLEVATPDVPAAPDPWTAATELATGRNPGAWLGYSMGGRIALHLALHFPELVERLVLVSATAGIDDPVDRAVRRESDEGLARWVERAGVEVFLDRWLAGPLFASLPPDAAGREARLVNSPATLTAHLRALGTGSQEPLWHRLGELRMPVLIVAGERDPKFVALGHRLAEGIGEGATTAIVPGAGHACQLEAPAAFLDAVLPFLTHPAATDHRTSPTASSTP